MLKRAAAAATCLTALLVLGTPACARAGDGPLPLPLLAHLPFYPVTTVRPSAHPLRLSGRPHDLDVTYTYQGRRHTLEDFLRRSSATGFLVLHGDSVVDERYFSGYGPASRFNSWSVGKSVTSAAVGAAIRDGKIRSVDEPVTRYVPELRGTGYDGVALRDILHMASGHRYDENDYLDPTKGATNTMIRMVSGTPLSVQAREAVRDRAPGTRFNYDSMNTFVLGWAVTKATGVPLATYVQEKIWRPAGMESPLLVGHDSAGNDIAYCCYHATVRDFARFGLLYLRGGKGPGGRQVIAAGWVRDSTHSTEPYLQPHHLDPDPAGSDYPYGYGYQWWLGDGARGDFTAIGILGQFVYVSPRDRVVIVKTSQDLNADAHEAEALPAFRAVADKVGS